MKKTSNKRDKSEDKLEIIIQMIQGLKRRYRRI